MQTDFLSLDLARIASHQAGLAQKRLERRIVLDQRARQTVAHGPRLAELPSSLYVHPDVELGQLVGQHKGLAHDHLPGFACEVLVRRTVVHDHITLAGLDEHPRYGTLTSSGSVIVLSDHALVSSAFGCCAA